MELRCSQALKWLTESESSSNLRCTSHVHKYRRSVKYLVSLSSPDLHALIWRVQGDGRILTDSLAVQVGIVWVGNYLKEVLTVSDYGLFVQYLPSYAEDLSRVFSHIVK